MKFLMSFAFKWRWKIEKTGQMPCSRETFVTQICIYLLLELFNKKCFVEAR